MHDSERRLEVRYDSASVVESANRTFIHFPRIEFDASCKREPSRASPFIVVLPSSSSNRQDFGSKTGEHHLCLELPDGAFTKLKARIRGVGRSLLMINAMLDAENRVIGLQIDGESVDSDSHIVAKGSGGPPEAAAGKK